MGSTVEELSPVAPDAVQRGGHLPITNDAKRVQAVPYPLREEYTQDTLQPWQISLEDELGLNKLGFRSAELTKVPEWIHLPGQDYVDNAWNAMIGYVWNLVSPGALKDYPKVTNLDVMGFIAGPKAVEPELEDPDALSREDVEQFILEMNELLDHIRDMNADMDEEVDFEQLIVSMYKSQIEETESQLDENKEKIVETNQKRKSIN
ncbi:MAG: hypothetical protein KDK78_04235, partial [Chlamydiia bacterium]|nr:hypothetical protein [Chlamydiia bacterium]